jgi:hypothetical protein
MAIIADQVPPPLPLPPDVKGRVVVKFRPDTRLPYSRDAGGELARQRGREWSELTRAFPSIGLSPYFSTIEESTLAELMNRTPRVAGAPINSNFVSYYAVDYPSGASPERIAEIIAQWPTVETAYVEAGPVPPPLRPSDDPRNLNQGYLNTAPEGIDARWAWAKPMEAGWDLSTWSGVGRSITQTLPLLTFPSYRG